MDGGQKSTSPNAEWYAHLASGGGFEISLFDTARFPELKEDDAWPSRAQLDHPTAQYLIPVPIRARVAKMKWEADGKVLHIVQGPINSQPAIGYTVDLQNFQLIKD